ncbi:Glycosyl hydrolase family 26 [Paenibacillus tianmuensis]|uniref:Glycosyl hydrolase family 26 n=1 Tax=Paenibacillus tianmuensis TaxID=624147 RepID=A0A1G4TBU2_9BACL|nr:glycosyl hydrolase [Paenibacillus tianmuensis]SCW78677.1 Glycosyl hydrolase family 26 [Paenibacillus tianmuensis]
MKLKKTYLISGAVLVVLLGVFIARSMFSESEFDSQSMATYTDSPYGYELRYPKQMKVDQSLPGIRTRFSDETTQIDVYYDDFNGTVSDAAAYIGYGNKFIENTKDHRVSKNETKTIGGRSVHLLKWERDKLKHVENDKPYYATAEIVKNDKEIYTIAIKSSQPITNDEKIVKLFRLIPPQGDKPALGTVTKKVPLKTNQETAEVYRKLFMTDGLKWGIFEPTAPKRMDILHALEQKLDYKFNTLILYKSLNTEFPMEELKNAQNDNRLVELTMQTMRFGEPNPSVMYDILSGKYDEYFTKYAQGLKEFGHPLLFRLNNEMNGDWVPYSAYHYSKDPDLYNEVWKYIYRTFQSQGVNNVLWVWNPNHLDKPGFKWNHSLLYYPGDEFVDVVGLTAYNTGNYYPGEKWSTFDELYAPLYADYTKWFEQPLMITEFSSSSVGGDKAKWVDQMFKDIKKYPKLKAAIWWSHTDFDKDNRPARKYKLDEAPELVERFRQHLQEYK